MKAICQACGARFEKATKSQKYCSPGCRIAANREAIEWIIQKRESIVIFNLAKGKIVLDHLHQIKKFKTKKGALDWLEKKALPNDFLPMPLDLALKEERSRLKRDKEIIQQKGKCYDRV